VAHVTNVRQSWVRAVAAQQHLNYAKQVFEAAEASQVLAGRMQTTGNFNKLQRAQQQLFYADAATQWALAQHAHTAAKEQLVRFLGLTSAQAQKFKLPARLPDLPAAPTAADVVVENTKKTWLDVQLAQQNFALQDRAQALEWVNSLTDIELGLRADTSFNTKEHSTHSKQGVELELRLPLFDAGDLQRDAIYAQRLAATQQLEATVRQAASQLRESYSAYRTAYDVAQHYRDEIVPLRKSMSDENLLRYNGMLIGVFDLLQDSREQIATVMAALRAQEQFWLTDAALQATMIGQPTSSTLSSAALPTEAAKH
jgi:outer membrane protein TolC